MILAAISDLHGDIPEIPKCDVLCISGDIVPLDIQRSVTKSENWLKNEFMPAMLNADCKHVIMTWGNHDFIGNKLYLNGIAAGQQQAEHIFGEYNEKIHILIDECITVDGHKFYGTPWCPELYTWAFYGDHEFLIDSFSKIPEDTEVLLTHCPPKIGTQGVVLEKCWNYFKDFGCKELYDVLSTKTFEKQLNVICGHVHSGCHDIEVFDNIKFVNVSLKDESYNISYRPKIIEI